ncbi:MAG: hypothetical protein ACFFD4_07565 [Candidatus Odinarchaeota archaeon]
MAGVKERIPSGEVIIAVLQSGDKKRVIKKGGIKWYYWLIWGLMLSGIIRLIVWGISCIGGN